MEVVYLMSLCKLCLLSLQNKFINSCSLPTNVLNDVTSLAPLSPVNLLTMNLKIVMLPPGHFTSPDQYCRKHWRRVQHLSNKFWNQWRKEVLPTMQNHGKWNKQQRNCKVGDVLSKDDVECDWWPMAKIVAQNSDA